MFKEVQKNLMWEASWASNVYYIPQILLTILWVVLFIFIQIPAGMVELLFWWLMNPWWDLIMLTFFAIANALWQNCGMCTLEQQKCQKSCSKCQGSRVVDGDQAVLGNQVVVGHQVVVGQQMVIGAPILMAQGGKAVEGDKKKANLMAQGGPAVGGDKNAGGDKNVGGDKNKNVMSAIFETLKKGRSALGVPAAGGKPDLLSMLSSKAAALPGGAPPGGAGGAPPGRAVGAPPGRAGGAPPADTGGSPPADAPGRATGGAPLMPSVMEGLLARATAPMNS